MFIPVPARALVTPLFVKVIVSVTLFVVIDIPVPADKVSVSMA